MWETYLAEHPQNKTGRWPSAASLKIKWFCEETEGLQLKQICLDCDESTAWTTEQAYLYMHITCSLGSCAGLK